MKKGALANSTGFDMTVSHHGFSPPLPPPPPPRTQPASPKNAAASTPLRGRLLYAYSITDPADNQYE